MIVPPSKSSNPTFEGLKIEKRETATNRLPLAEGLPSVIRHRFVAANSRLAAPSSSTNV
jgi:hypothetical protein